MEGNDVALAEQLFYLHDLNVVVCRRGATRRCENVHTEGASDGGDLLSDAAVTDDAEIKAGEFDERKIPVAEIGTSVPSAIAHGLSVVSDAVGEFEQKGEGGLGDGVRAVCRDVSDSDPLLFRGLNVDDIEPGRGHADVFQVRQSLDRATIDGDFVCERRVCTLQTMDYFVLGGSFVESGFAQLLDVIPRKVAGIERVTVQHHNFHAGRE